MTRRWQRIAAICPLVLFLTDYTAHRALNAQLVNATRRDDLAAVRVCLSLGASANSTNDQMLAPLQFAVIRHDAPMVRLLLDKGADPTPALRMAVTEHRPDILTMLLDAGADVHALTGQVALCRAVMSDDPSAIRLLLAHGADKEARAPIYFAEDTAGGDARTAPDQLTPLLLAAYSGRWNAFRELVDQGADLSALSTRGRSALKLTDMGGVNASDSSAATGCARIRRYLLPSGKTS